MKTDASDNDLAVLGENLALVSAYLHPAEICLNSPRLALALHKRNHTMGDIFKALKVAMPDIDAKQMLLLDLATAYCKQFEYALEKELTWKVANNFESEPTHSTYLDKKIKSSMMLKNHIRLQQEGIALLESIDNSDTQRVNKIREYWAQDPFVNGDTNTESLTKLVEEISELQRRTTEDWFIEDKADEVLSKPVNHDESSASSSSHLEREVIPEESDFKNKYVSEQTSRNSIKTVRANSYALAVKLSVVSLVVLFILCLLGGYFWYSSHAEKPIDKRKIELEATSKIENFRTESLIPKVENFPANHESGLPGQQGNVMIGENSSPSQLQQIKSRMKTGMKYRYFPDGSCVPKDDVECISLTDWKELCDSADGATEYAMNLLSVLPGPNILFKHGVTETIRIQWTGSICRVYARASGIVNGNSERVEISGKGTELIKSSTGKILVHYIDIY